jgi:hypothetical protein
VIKEDIIVFQERRVSCIGEVSGCLVDHLLLMKSKIATVQSDSVNAAPSSTMVEHLAFDAYDSLVPWNTVDHIDADFKG